jgi:serine/threonine protein kinase
MEPPEDTWNFAEGDRITPELVAVRRLGGGAAYDAYLAFDEVTWGPVVVKVLRPAQVASPSSLRGLRREVDALEAVNHPVVVRKLRHSFCEERPHLVLESIDGPRLSTLLRRYGPLQPAQYLPLAIDIASALQYLRHIGHVHLDIKPSNVIMGAPARLIDLSLARPEPEAAVLDHPIGTDSYMAPEQADPPRTGSPSYASDVFGLSATLFEALAGYRPYDDGDPDAITPADQWPQLTHAPYDLPETVPTPVTKLVLAGLEREPENRPTPMEIAEGLEPVYTQLPKGRLAGFRVR